LEIRIFFLVILEEKTRILKELKRTEMHQRQLEETGPKEEESEESEEEMKGLDLPVF